MLELKLLTTSFVVPTVRPPAKVEVAVDDRAIRLLAAEILPPALTKKRLVPPSVLRESAVPVVPLGTINRYPFMVVEAVTDFISKVPK